MALPDRHDGMARSIGIVMGQTHLLANDLAAGRLVRPFERPVRRDLAYYLLIPEGRTRSRKVAALRNWLNSEIGTADEGGWLPAG
jgi:LysR family glycine cleavage system transcriptional activator